MHIHAAGIPCTVDRSYCLPIVAGAQPTSVSCSNLTEMSDPHSYGLYYTLASQGALAIYLVLQSAAVGGAVIDVGPYVDYTIYDGTIDLATIPVNIEAGQSISLGLRSNTSQAAMTNVGVDGWSVALTDPTGNVTNIGLMQPAGVVDATSRWAMQLQGSYLTQVCQ